MAKPTPPIVYHSGDVKLTVFSSFLYEVQVYLIRRDRAECVGSKFYTTDKPIKVKESQFVKVNDEITCAKYITWLAAPLDYLTNNNFKVLEHENARQGRKPNTNSNKRRRANSRG